MERQGLERQDLDEEDFVRLGASFPGVGNDEVRGRGLSAPVVEARELLAAVMRKHPVTASGWVIRGVQKSYADGGSTRVTRRWIGSCCGANEESDTASMTLSTVQIDNTS